MAEESNSAVRNLRPLACVDEAPQHRFLINIPRSPTDQVQEAVAKLGVCQDGVGRGAGLVSQGNKSGHDQVVVDGRTHS